MGLELGLGLGLGLDGADEDGEDLMRERRDAPDVPRELEARTHAHEQRDAHARGREVLAEVEVQSVGDRAQLDRDRRDGARRSQDQQRLAAKKRLARRSRVGRSVHRCILDSEHSHGFNQPGARGPHQRSSS